MKVRAFISRDWRGGFRLCLFKDAARGKVDVLSGFTWEEIDEGGWVDPMAGIGDAGDMIQQIVDKAWEAGFRPSGFSDIKNETAAIKAHLADMKSIAFHKLGIKS